MKIGVLIVIGLCNISIGFSVLSSSKTKENGKAQKAIALANIIFGIVLIILSVVIGLWS